MLQREEINLLDIARSITAQANLPKIIGDVILDAGYILNQVPFKSVQHTPHELWTGMKSKLENLRLWSSSGYVHIPFHKWIIGHRTTNV